MPNSLVPFAVPGPKSQGSQIPFLRSQKPLYSCQFHHLKHVDFRTFWNCFHPQRFFLWVTGRVGCLLNAINIPIFVYSIMSSGRSYHPDFPPLSSPRTGHNPPAAPRCATLRPNLSRVVRLVDEGRNLGWIDSTSKNIGRPRYTMIHTLFITFVALQTLSTMKSHPDPDTVFKKHIFLCLYNPLQEIRYPNFFNLKTPRLQGEKLPKEWTTYDFWPDDLSSVQLTIPDLKILPNHCPCQQAPRQWQAPGEWLAIGRICGQMMWKHT